MACLNGFAISHFFEVLSRLDSLHLKSAKNCGLHFTFDEDVDLCLNFFYLSPSYIRKKLQFF